MAYTNQTTNLELPQYVGTDKPTYLGDFNTAMANIDNGYASNKALGEGADTKATTALANSTQAQADASSAQTTATQAQTLAGQADVKAETALNNSANANTKADSAIAKANANETKIGDLAQLNTVDKSSLVNAINEINDDWQEIDATGSVDINLPSVFKEISIEVRVGSSFCWSFYFPKKYFDDLTVNSYRNYRSGHYISSSNNSACNIEIKKTTVKLLDAYGNGTNATNDAKVSLFYR